MGRAVVKLAEDEYVEWSTVVDAPVSWIVDRAGAVERWTEDRVARADEHGDSFLDLHVDVAGFNRAGQGEECLTVDEIREQYRWPFGEGEAPDA